MSKNEGQKKTSILFRINPEGKTAKMIKQLLSLDFHLEFDSEGRIIAKKSGTYNEISKTIIELKDKGFKL
ncbi:hypothetical protein ES702_00330 [subsurface metagenome]